MKPIAVKLPEELLRELDLIAMNKRLSRSDIIREALELYLKNGGVHGV